MGTQTMNRVSSKLDSDVRLKARDAVKHGISDRGRTTSSSLGEYMVLGTKLLLQQAVAVDTGSVFWMAHQSRGMRQ